MNKYDELYTFRIAEKADTEKIMLFLKEEWGESHILSNDKDFFLWQYGNEHYGDNDTINFVLMEDKQGNIVGLNGFIPYDSAENIRNVSSAITKVKQDISIPMAGVELIKRFKELVHADKYYSSGTNPQTIAPIGERIFHYTVNIMQQYYMLNPSMQNFEIAEVIERPQTEEVLGEGCQLLEIKNMDEIEEYYNLNSRYFYQGYKSKAYLIKRYDKHPVYVYKKFVLLNERRKRGVGVLIAREIVVNNSRILRIVDYLGDILELKKTGKELQRLLVEHQYEYVDLLVGEIAPELIRGSGLRLRGDEAIIPMYFEPFVKKNIDVWYQKSDKDLIIFKADGDQDRPNSVVTKNIK